jgi:hypothetical protein
VDPGTTVLQVNKWMFLFVGGLAVSNLFANCALFGFSVIHFF